MDKEGIYIIYILYELIVKENIILIKKLQCESNQVTTETNYF